MLINSKHWQGELKEVCSLILDETIKEDDKYQVGLTKLFFRTGMLAYLEGLRADRLNHLVTLVQKNLRRQIASRQYKAMKVSSVRIQSWWRGIAARKLVDAKRKEAAVVKIQKVVRGYIQRKKFLETRAAAVKIQSGESCHSFRSLCDRIKAHLSLSSFRQSCGVFGLARGSRSNACKIQQHLFNLCGEDCE